MSTKISIRQCHASTFLLLLVVSMLLFTLCSNVAPAFAQQEPTTVSAAPTAQQLHFPLILNGNSKDSRTIAAGADRLLQETSIGFLLPSDGIRAGSELLAKYSVPFHVQEDLIELLFDDVDDAAQSLQRLGETAEFPVIVDRTSDQDRMWLSRVTAEMAIKLLTEDKISYQIADGNAVTLLQITEGKLGVGGLQMLREAGIKVLGIVRQDPIQNELYVVDDIPDQVTERGGGILLTAEPLWDSTLTTIIGYRLKAETNCCADGHYWELYRGNTLLQTADTGWINGVSFDVMNPVLAGNYWVKVYASLWDFVNQQWRLFEENSNGVALPLAAPSLIYRVHVKNWGWMDWVSTGEIAGTTGQHRRVEALQVKLINPKPEVHIKYRAHVAGKGWLDWVYDRATAGTTGESRRAEAFQIMLENAPNLSVEYQVHVKGKGWLEWVRDGATAGTTGESRRVEAIRIRLVPTIVHCTDQVFWLNDNANNGDDGTYINASWDGANCYVKPAPSGSTPFVYDNKYYVKPNPTQPRCPSGWGWYDGANCYLGKPTKGKAFLLNNTFYFHEQ